MPLRSLATFRVPGHDTAAAVSSLGRLGFVFGARQPVTTTLVDTFDGRLHRAGLRLERRNSDGIELVLSGEDVVPAHLSLDVDPRVLTDLPHGPFRSRIASLVDVRALLPQVRVRMDRSVGVWRDGTGKSVAIADVCERVRIANRRDIEPITTIEIHAVPGYAKRARRAVEVLEDLGLEPCVPDTLTQCAAAAGVDLAGFKASATVPLDPAMGALDGVRAVFANLEVAIAANWQGAVDQIDTKFLHDLRIALRRTRTVLAASKAVVPAAVLGPAKADFAWLAGATGAARDLDVYLLEWERYTAPLGGAAAAPLIPVRDVLARQHTEAHLELERVLRSERAGTLIEQWRSWLAAPIAHDALPRRAGRPLGNVVAKRLAGAHDALIERGRQIAPDTPAADVHDLRKDAKRLRYLVECFGSMLPDKPQKKYVERLKALQENLGEHQDAEVHIALLISLTPELESAGVPAATMIALGQLTERLEQTRVGARAEFAERFADFDGPATRRSFDALIEAIAT